MIYNTSEIPEWKPDWKKLKITAKKVKDGEEEQEQYDKIVEVFGESFKKNKGLQRWLRENKIYPF